VPIQLRTTKGEQVRVTFVLPPDEPAGRVSLVGDFNDWRPGAHELKKRSNGNRSTHVIVSPGTTLCFRYLAEGDLWFDDPDAHTRDHRGGLYMVES
jgi:1,4-alpha-glucan branching enzyme